MNIETLEWKDIIGSSGAPLHLLATQNEITEALGVEPDRTPTGDGKVTVEWRVRIDGTLVTIYDYKDPAPADRDEEFHWRVGGNGPWDEMAVALGRVLPGQVMDGW
jgi:hypothetical protein